MGQYVTKAASAQRWWLKATSAGGGRFGEVEQSVACSWGGARANCPRAKGTGGENPGQGGGMLRLRDELSV